MRRRRHQHEDRDGPLRGHGFNLQGTEIRMLRNFGLGALLAVSLAASATQQSLHLSELWSTKGSPDVVEFGAIRGMAETSSGDIWISDQLLKLVLAVDSAGHNLRVVAREGNGPGEVRAPGFIWRTAGGELAIHDVAPPAIHVFRADGTFDHVVRLEHLVWNPKGFVVLPGGEFAISGGISRDSNAIHLFSPTGRLVGGMHRVPKTRDPQAGLMVAGGPLSVTRDGRLLFSQAAPHAIYSFASDAAQASLIASEPELVEPIGDDFIHDEGPDANRVRTFKWDFPRSRAVFELADGAILNVIWLQAEGASIWEVYAANGRLLARRRVDRAYVPWALTANGDVLASYEDPETGEAIAARLRIRR